MSARSSSAMGPSLPQVNLLPPEVEAARGLARTKRWLAFVLVAAIIGAGGLVWLAIQAEEVADAELADQQAETERLNDEVARYSEVPIVLAALSRARDAREVGMSTEILWKSYLQAIAATAPAGVRIDSLLVQGATPMLGASAPTDALAAWSVKTVTFNAESTTLFDTEAWLRQLVTVPGFADPWFSQATLDEKDGVIYYTVSATVQVNEDAYSQRFAAETLAEAEAEDGTETGGDD